MALHESLTDNHVAYDDTYADAAARAADVSKVAGDVGKFYRQLDDNSIWMLLSTAPTWVQVGGGSGGGGFLTADGTVTGATAQLQLFTTGVGVGASAAKQSAYAGAALTVAGTSQPVVELWVNSDSIADIGFGGAVSWHLGTAGTQVALIAARADGTDEVGGHLAFSTKEDAQAITEKMRLTGAGDLGLGTAAPLSNVDIQDTIPELTLSTSNATVLLGDVLGKITWYSAADLSTNAIGEVAQIRVEADIANYGGVSRGGRIIFATQTIGDPGTFEDWMEIDGYGAVELHNGGIRPDADSTTALQLQNAAGDAVVVVDTTNNKMFLSDTAVTHGMTTLDLTNTYAAFEPISATLGGLLQSSYSDGDANALKIRAVIGASNPTDTIPAILFEGGKANGTGWQALAAAETVFQIKNYSTVLATILGDGKVGFGTATPDYKLELLGASGVTLGMGDTDMSHPYTSIASANTFFHIRPGTAADGGADLYGITDLSGTALRLIGMIGVTDPTDTTPAVLIDGRKSDGATGAAALADAETVFKLRNNGTGLITVLGDGKTGVGTATPDYTMELSGSSLVTFAISDTDVSHPYTDVLQADTLLMVRRIHETEGGAVLYGVSDTDATGLKFIGFMGSNNPTDTKPAIVLDGRKSNAGTGSAAMAAAETVLRMDSDSSPVWKILGDGTVVQYGSGIRPSADSTTALQLQNAAGTSILNVDTTNSRVGIGTTPSNMLDIVSGATTGTQIHVGEAANEGGYITSQADANLYLMGGAEIVAGAYTARSTTASMVRMSGGTLNIATDSALTDGNTFTPSQRMVVTAQGRVGFNVAAPGAQVDIDQSAPTGSVPVLQLDQADLSEGFINYVGSSSADAVGPISTWTTGNSIQGFTADEINGVRYWRPYYDAPTS